MNEITHYLATHWTEWIFAFLSAVLMWGYRDMKHQRIVDTERNNAIREGVESLLRDRIIQSYNHYQDKGYCPIYGKENVKRMYDAYHALGGNDVATKLKDTLLLMPEEAAEEEED